MAKVAILIPAFKRPEYTTLCINSVREADNYEQAEFFLVDEGNNREILENFKRPQDKFLSRQTPKGLRNSILDFFDWVLSEDFEFLTKVDNDCTVPKNWLSDLLKVMEESEADIISPNVSETNAAFKYGYVPGKAGHFLPSQVVGGLWFMRRAMIENIYFERFNSRGINAAFNILRQIVVEKEPKIGWTDLVTYDDVGFWAGTHRNHIKSVEHAEYSAEVGRRIGWSPKNG